MHAGLAGPLNFPARIPTHGSVALLSVRPITADGILTGMLASSISSDHALAKASKHIVRAVAERFVIGSLASAEIERAGALDRELQRFEARPRVRAIAKRLRL